jgi:hypothetical protein
MLVFSRDVELAATKTAGTHDGFHLTYSNEICDRGRETRSSSIGPAGKGNDPQDCMQGCAASEDCFFASITAVGWCR